MLANYKVNIAEFSKDLWMKKEHLRKLQRDGHVIGSHSHTHPIRMIHLSSEEQKKEYQISFEILKKILGQKPQVMSHPCDSYNQQTLKILQDLGFVVGFGAYMADPVLLPHLEYPREDHINVIKKMIG